MKINCDKRKRNSETDLNCSGLQTWVLMLLKSREVHTIDIFVGAAEKTGLVYLFVTKSEPIDTVVLNERARLGT